MLARTVDFSPAEGYHELDGMYLPDEHLFNTNKCANIGSHWYNGVLSGVWLRRVNYEKSHFTDPSLAGWIRGGS
jgi:hypothetical protein